jgi:hypothetical protein
MKKRLFISILLFAHTTAFAETALPSGSFGLDFTDKPDEPVFKIESASADIKVISLADQSVYAGTIMTTESKQKLWSKLSWTDKSFESANCISFEREAICNVPENQRKNNTSLNALKSDFFHYDPMAGVVTAFPLK